MYFIMSKIIRTNDKFVKNSRRSNNDSPENTTVVSTTYFKLSKL